ncbi:hypothetical protein [Methanobacterium paludis]|uniref:PsbP C-terminal domain-containing protein n=1 Tax=Methanobacterium paludis (strain DSM 25820 / JCM 18151 / SWAN1) TaxID=868131 RepID=F6D749_METPW|nr:hypothetical protein [Methanobacterium paludis]AEG19008.1 hypothetical protein MSWAN_1999 [Methanobacterium paludis]
MDLDRYVLPVIAILVILILIVTAISLSGNSTFQTGNLHFEYPNTWNQDHIVGNFSNESLYSEVTFTANFKDNTSQEQPAYITIQMQQKSEGVVNLPNSNSIFMNTTNSSIASVEIGNITATQMGSYGQNIAKKVTTIENNNYYYTIAYICPPYAMNQTEEAYNTIIKTLKIS